MPQEASDIAEQFAAFKEEMSEAQESIEMATLDKEMAEEKVRFGFFLWKNYVFPCHKTIILKVIIIQLDNLLI